MVIRNRFGPGEGPIWLDTLNCTGDESRLDVCDHNEWGQHDCSHDEDVAISCMGVLRKSSMYLLLSRNTTLLLYYLN